MLHPAQKIASFFVAKKLIPAQDYEWAVYGLQRRLLAAVFYPLPISIEFCWRHGNVGVIARTCQANHKTGDHSHQ